MNKWRVLTTHAKGCYLKATPARVWVIDQDAPGGAVHWRQHGQSTTRVIALRCNWPDCPASGYILESALWEVFAQLTGPAYRGLPRA